jgi:asparagine synthase (glutamine-hydrolysing)
MCGIAGKVSLSSNQVTITDIKRMSDSITHRGPDDSGVYISPDHKVGLGHRRLSIIDLSPLGHQPMNYLNRYQIVFNGEIYNFEILRRDLMKAGYRFRSKSDTEVILALYDKYGIHFLNRLRGMFAFAIYDQKKNTLFCARDRVGKKPFKYYFNSQVFIFASELKAILTQPEYSRSPDLLAIHNYLTYQYCPAPETGFTDIKKLEAGNYLLLNINTGEITQERYWHLDYSQKMDLSENEWKERIMEKLEESVKLRLISDVPLGAFLSGGIDSSAVVALMAKNSSTPVKTFSIGFQEQKFNELKYARIVADKFHTDHTEFTVKSEDIEILPDLVKQYEEPYADSSALATYYLSKLTREHVTVALNGDGGDENFAGYSRYGIQKFVMNYEKFKLINTLINPLTHKMFEVLPSTFTDRVRKFSDSLNEKYSKRYVNYICYFDNNAKKSLYSDNFARLTESINSNDIVSKYFEYAKTPDALDQTLFTDISTYLPEDLLVKVDIASMANSLEARSPFLDHELLELTAKMPNSLKLKGFNDKKYILKQALRGLVPDEVMFRPKMGFVVPLDSWFKGDLSAYVEKILLSKKALSRNLFNKEYIAHLLTEHKQIKMNHSSRIWAMLSLELWFREYFD